MPPTVTRHTSVAPSQPTSKAAPKGVGKRWPSLPRQLGYILFFMMLFVPTHYQRIKLVLLVVVLTSIALAWATGRLLVRAQLAVPVLLYAGLGVFFCWYGLLQRSPGALEVATVYVLWPLVFLFLASAIATLEHLASLVRVMVLASVAIGLYADAYLLAARGVLPSWLLTHTIAQEQIYYSPTEGLVTANFTTLAPLLFLLPFLVCLAFSWPKGHELPVPRLWLYVAIFANLALAILSARRGLVLVVAATPLVLIALSIRTRPAGAVKIRLPIGPLLFVGMALMTTAVLLHLDLDKVYEEIRTGFLPQASSDAQIRSRQAQVLWDAFGEHPILGTGLGGVTPGFVRSINTPWAYELSYLALLFHLGLVGFLLYVGIVVTACARVARNARRLGGEYRMYVVPMLVGVATFLIGNASNPYLEKFDSMWVLFFPVALLNVAHGLPTRQDAEIAPAFHGTARHEPASTGS